MTTRGRSTRSWRTAPQPAPPPEPPSPPPRTFAPQGPTLGALSDAYLRDYQVRPFRQVRAPAGRLRLLRQIRDELVPGVEPFLLVDDVVAVEDGAGLVAGQANGDPLRHAGAGRPGSGAQRLASCGPVTIRTTTPHNAAICPWRLALLCLLAPGPVFLHPDAGCLLGGVRHLPPLTTWRRRRGCRWARIQLRKGL